MGGGNRQSLKFLRFLFLYFFLLSLFPLILLFFFLTFCLIRFSLSFCPLPLLFHLYPNIASSYIFLLTVITRKLWNRKTTLHQLLSLFDVVTKQIVVLNLLYIYSKISGSYCIFTQSFLILTVYLLKGFWFLLYIYSKFSGSYCIFSQSFLVLTVYLLKVYWFLLYIYSKFTGS